MYGFVKHPFVLLDVTPNITSFHLLTPAPNSLDQFLVLSRMHKKVKMGLTKPSFQQLSFTYYSLRAPLFLDCVERILILKNVVSQGIEGLGVLFAPG